MGSPTSAPRIALGVAAVVAATLAWCSSTPRRWIAATLAVDLALLTVFDPLHDGAHPSTSTGRGVVVLAVVAVGLLVITGIGFSRRGRATLFAAILLLAGSFLTNGLDNLDLWFERLRGDPIREYQIVVKQGLELASWALIALAVWGEALRNGRRCTAVTSSVVQMVTSEKRRVA